jgi:ribonuclease G
MLAWLKKKGSKIEIIINSESLETRVAVLEGGKVEEFLVEHPTEDRIVGSIFKGRIQNLEHDLQAAFVDIGMKKNAFLHYWDMIPDEDALKEMTNSSNKRRRTPRRKRYTNEEIEKRFAPGADIVVQVTKGAIGNKGPRVSANLSIPGRHLVMMPGSKLKGVSKKIHDSKERERLKKIVAQLQIPAKVGVIVRTAGSGARKKSFMADLRGLIAIWEELKEAIATKKGPCCIYEEPGLVERIVRDWLTEDVDKIIVDSEDQYNIIRNIASRISRRARSRIQLYKGDLPIFAHYGVDKQVEAAFRRRVMLPSGGHIVIDETEALIAIDVNSGRHKGSGSQEQAILEVNSQAIEEVARQLRLRNIGGLVVIDLIDMRMRKHQNTIYRAMKAALKRDRARVNVLQISELGLMEMTRQRVEESILSSMVVDCPYCHGRGTVKSPLSMSVDIQRQIAALMRRRTSNGKSLNLEVVIHPTVLSRMQKEDEKFLIDLESTFEGHLTLKSDPNKHMEYFLIKDAETGDALYSITEK